MIDGPIDVHQHARPAAVSEAVARTSRRDQVATMAMMVRTCIATALVPGSDAVPLCHDCAVARRPTRLPNDLGASGSPSRRRVHLVRFQRYAAPSGSVPVLELRRETTGAEHRTHENNKIS